MAKYGKTLAQVTVEINGKKQAEQVLKALNTAAADMRKNIRSAKDELEQLALSGGGPAYDAKKKEILGMEKELQQLERSIRETKKFSEDVGSILDNMSKNSATTLTRTKRALESLLNSIVPNTKKAQKQIELLQKSIKQVTDEIARRKGQLTEFEDIMGDLGKATPKQLDAVEKRLLSLMDSVTKNSRAWHQYNKELQAVQGARDSRKKSEMEKQMENVAKLSVNARNELKKYWQSVNDGAKKGSKAFRESLQYLQKIEEVETKMASDQAKKVLSSPNRYSVGEINEAIKVGEQMQADTKSKKEWAELAEQIAEAKNVRDSFADSAKLKVMSEQFKHVKDLSVNAFAEQKKYWTEVKNSLTESDPLYKKAIANLEKMEAIETDRMKDQSTETLTTNLNKAGTADIKQSVEWLTKYQSTLEPLGDEWRNIDDLIKKGNDRLKEVTDTVKREAMETQFGELKTLSSNALSEQLKYWEGIRDNAKATDADYKTAIDNIKEINDLTNRRMKDQSTETLTTNLNKAGTADIKQSVEWLTKYQGTLDPVGKEWERINNLITAGNERLKQLSDNAKMKAMSDQFIRLTQLSEKALADQKRYWEEVFKSSEKGTANYILAESKLQQIKGLEDSRVRSEAQSTISQALSGGFNKTNEETREAIKLIEEYKKLLATGNVDAIKEADKAITELNRKLDQAKKSSALDVLGDMDNHSSEQIKQAVDWLTKYRSTLATSTQEWKDLGVEIQKANEYMDKAEGADKLAIMEQKLLSIGTVSTSALAELKKYWQEVVDGTDKNNTSLAQYEDNLKKVIEEEKTRKAISAEAVMTNLDGSNVQQIRDAVKATEELRDAVSRSHPDWNRYNSQIENAQNYLQKFETESKKAASLDVAANLDIASTGQMKQAIDFLTKYRDTLSTIDPEYDSITQAIDDTTKSLKEFNDSTKLAAMNKQMQNLGSLSKSALAEQKKYWQEVKDNFAEGTSQYDNAIDKLKEIRNLEETQTRVAAKVDIHAALGGNWNRTIEDTEKAIKLIEEYKKQLQVKSDATAIDQANQAIEILNRNLGKAKEALMDVDDAKKIADEVSTDSFNGAAEDIEKAKKALEEYRKTLKLGGATTELEAVDRMLNNLARSAELGGKNLKSLDAVLADLKHASMDDLQTAAKQLQHELQGATRSTEEYAKTAAKLRDVNRELERAQKEWEGQESLFIRMTKRLSVYMAAYGSLSFIVDRVKELGQSNLQLSDSIADVAKTTGLEAKELAKLGSEIRAIDTRTAQEQLYELAAAAGQLGLKSETDIAGFVRAANMITVSLNELGTEATTQLMKIATLTGEAQKGTETALLSIGSAINELTASSAAAAGPIVDLMNRMGGIAAQSGITSAQMAAIGATADALGQSVEITGTSMNKFLATLMSSSDQIAYALNMDAKALRSFLNEGRTMDAVIAVFEKMNQMGGLGKLAPVMGELGSEGARMTQVLAAMAEKVDFLKGQLDISTKAYEEAVSIQNEYNVKNENAVAILQRMGNAIKEFFVNNMVVDIITAVLRAMYQFFSFLGQGTVGAKALASSLVLLTTALISTRIQWVRTINEMSRVDVFRNILLWLKNLTAGTISLTAAWKNLGKALKANWFSLLIGAVAALGTWIYKTATYVSEAAKATAKYNRELQEEKDKVDQLFNSLKRLNTSESDRARIINSINQQYGQYLGFMLDEKDSAEKLAAAHQLINAELRKRMALNLQNTLTGKANNEYAASLDKTIADIAQKVGNIKVRVNGPNKKSEDRVLYATDVMNTVSEMINDRVYESVKVTQEEVNGQIVHRQQMGTVDLDKLKADIRSALEKEFENVQTYDANGNIIKADKTFTGQLVFGNIESYIKSMLEERIKYQKSIINAENQANIELRSATKAVLKERENINNELTEEIKNAQGNSEKLEANLQASDKALKAAEAAAEKYAKDDTSEEAGKARKDLKDAQENYAAEEKALKDHYEKIADNAYDYIDNQKEILKEHYANVDAIKDKNLKEQKIKERDAINAQIEEYTNIAKEAAKKVPGFDPWDKERDVKDWREFSEIVTNLDSSSAKALAAAFKKIKDEAALFPDDVQKVYELFQSQGVDKISLEKLGLTDANSVAELVFGWENQIREKLKTKFHRNTTLGFIFDEGNDREMKAKVRQDYQAAMSALEAYYKEYEDYIRQKRADMNITEEEMNRQILGNARKLNEDRQQLIKKFLGEENTFDQTGYIGKITKHDFFGDKNLDEMAKQYQQWGDAMTDGGRNQIAKAGVEIQKAFNKEQEKIKKELLKGDMFGSFNEQFSGMLDELSLLTTKYDNEIDKWLSEQRHKQGFGDALQLSPEDQERRIAELTKYADKAYKVDAEGLRKLMANNANYAEWINSLSGEQMTVLLQKLRSYYDDRIELTKKYQQQMTKEFEAMYKQTGQQAEYEQRKTDIENRTKSQENLEGYGITRGVDYGAKRQNVADNWQNEDQRYQDEIADYQKKRDALAKDLADTMRSKGMGSAEYQELYQQYLATTQLITDTEVKRNELLAQSQRDLTQVYMDEWTKRAERWGQWGEMFGEYLGEQVMLEKQANDARARGDLETAKKIEQQQKQNKQALIQNLLSKIVDEAALWAKEYALKMMFNSLMLAEDKKKAIEEVSLQGKQSTLSIFLNALTGQSEEHKKGLSGLVTGAIIFAATMALQALAKSAIANMFPEAASGTTANRKLSTGMLTYAEGNYPVLGNDGKVYEAKYEGSGMKTGIYGGGAHFGIFSEKQPEMIVDGKTTQKLILNYPYIYDAITTIAKNGRLVNAMPTFASGDYPAGMRQIAQVEAVDVSDGTNEQMAMMQEELAQSREVNRRLLKVLEGGLVAHVDGLENYKQQKKNERFLKRRGID